MRFTTAAPLPERTASCLRPKAFAEKRELSGSGEVRKGSALIIRYEGPRGSPGMPEMLSPGAALIGTIHENRRLYLFSKATAWPRAKALLGAQTSQTLQLPFCWLPL